jgi:hypothetical protein
MGKLLDGGTPKMSPHRTSFFAPSDPVARSSQKRTTTWTGLNVHLTERCNEDTAHVITDVQTTPAPPFGLGDDAAGPGVACSAPHPPQGSSARYGRCYC